jgi:hypothetical protein
MSLVSPKALKTGRRNSAVTTEEKVVSYGNERKTTWTGNKWGLSGGDGIIHE